MLGLPALRLYIGNFKKYTCILSWHAMGILNPQILFIDWKYLFILGILNPNVVSQYLFNESSGVESSEAKFFSNWWHLATSGVKDFLKFQISPFHPIRAKIKQKFWFTEIPHFQKIFMLRKSIWLVFYHLWVYGGRFLQIGRKNKDRYKTCVESVSK